METYSVTVNGITYEVQVEKKSSASAPAPRTSAAPAPQEVKKPASVVQGEKITAGAAGRSWRRKEAVKAGDTVVTRLSVSAGVSAVP